MVIGKGCHYFVMVVEGGVGVGNVVLYLNQEGGMRCHFQKGYWIF